MALKLHTIICSTRPGRVGDSVANWFHSVATEHADFDADLIDLLDFNLPVFDEPNHPALQKYQHAHTKAWASSVDSADAYVFVTPEYNFGPPPSLLNALNYLYLEWNYKPAGIVSYGGISGGLRSAQMIKLTLTTLKIVPLYEGVTVQNVADKVDKKHLFHAQDLHASSAQKMLDELSRWAKALRAMR